MTVTFDLAEEMDYFDGLETLSSYVHVAAGGNTTNTTVAGCLRRALNKNEASILGSLVLEGEWAAWHVPVSELTQDARPGDRFIDADTRTWLVKEANKQTLKTRWRLICERVQ